MSRCSTGASTTRSTACGSCPGRSSGQASRSGSRVLGKPRPLRRAARYEGFIPVNLEHPGQFARIVADLSELRQTAGRAAQPYEVVAALPPGSDPGRSAWPRS